MEIKSTMITEYKEGNMCLIVYRHEEDSGMFELDHVDLLNVNGGKILLTKDDARALQKIFKNKEVYI